MSEEKEISMNVDSPGQKDNESTPLLSHDQPPQPGTSNSAPQGPDSEVNIRGGVKYLQKGHYNEMNVGGARPKTSRPKKGARSKGQGKDGRRPPQNKGSYKVNIEGGVGYMQDGDHNVMNIGPQPRSDNSMDAGSTSIPASTDTLSRVVQEEDFQEIQEHIGWKWKNVAKRLGLSDGQIDGIEHDHKEEPLSEKVYQMLRKWKQLKGDSATVAVLIQALEQEGLHDVADKILKKN
ncbi:PREDICTED: receptor-interacting serine/threonine-protein kinase 1-like [Branchiostoma belcheri]|uniref:Receptor-interacting serine/threonine-protein kinase 1-like n=1 Tax=Branchiostoma belcheri TaxID=7741 RepID=A0A6P5A5U8_BRABE|nr:PREDICTED: receptor-interacting serine/threonine-protein kinase 1-like [Branchiostoma belcheri]